MSLKPLSLFLVVTLAFSACRKRKIPDADYQSEMRTFVIKMSDYARQTNPEFIVIPQNGARLMAVNGIKLEGVEAEYVNAISGQGQEDLYYGYNDNDEKTDPEDRLNITPFLDIGIENNKVIWVTDYCFTKSHMMESYQKNKAKNYVSFAAPDRELSVIPDYPIHNENDDSVLSISEVKNFLYLVNPTRAFNSKSEFVSGIDATNYDAFIIDLFYDEGESLTMTDLAALQSKPNGAPRLVLAYLSIGEAEDYRYYWNNNWGKRKSKPEWLYKENNRWKGNYKVFYWMESWQEIIFGSEDAYLDKILNAGFNGIYLDLIDAFETYEDIKN